jgi:hypothetical protein
MCAEGFLPGESVRENEGPLVGRILGKGPFEGEWELSLPDGSTVICLAENLRRLATLEVDLALMRV